MVRTNFVLVDLENVQPENIGLLYGGPFKIKVFLGATQCKISLELARALQAFGPDVEYIQMDGNGPNALDFHIAYYIGRLAAEYPDAYFHIISKDTGFDPLIKHLKAQRISCQRSAAVTDIPMIKIANAESVPERLDALLGNLIKYKAAKPRTVETLKNSIKTYFANKLSDHEIQALLDQLAQRGVIRVSQGKVLYELPP
ncbi:MAG: PIN domain-containing protein [Gammaproteobacteria bacterium]